MKYTVLNPRNRDLSKRKVVLIHGEEPIEVGDILDDEDEKWKEFPFERFTSNGYLEPVRSKKK